LRVLFIVYRDRENPSAVGGEIYFWELAKGLFKAGHNVTLLCSSFEGSKSRENKEGINVIRVRGSLSLPFKILKEYQQKLKGNFDVVVEEAVGGQRLPFFSTLYVKEPLVSVWHQRNEKIFFEQYPYPLAIVFSFLEFLQARLYRKRTIITPSKSAKEKLAALGFKRDKITVVYDGVEEIFTRAKTDNKRENVIVWLGKLRRYKRPDHAILALANVLKKTKRTYRLVIAGKVSEIDLEYVNELYHIAGRLGVSNHVEFKLNISDADKLKLLESASVLVQPSPVEGFSIVVMEANRCGTPVVVSDGVPGDVVLDGFNGFVYPFGDIGAFSSALIKLLSNKEEWSRLSKNASSWAQNFTWDSSSAKFNCALSAIVSSEEV
jgi:glycosyltransferase involved in cell wall biosynthesis